MSVSLIRDVGVRLSRANRNVVTASMSPAEDITTWTDIRLSLRLDPYYPRDSFGEKAAAKTGEIDLSDWDLFQSTHYAGTITDAATGVITFIVPRADSLLLSMGRRRGVLDVLRIDSGAEIQIVAPTWFDVVESVYDG
jgi:hypothetical protein